MEIPVTGYIVETSGLTDQEHSMFYILLHGTVDLFIDIIFRELPLLMMDMNIGMLVQLNQHLLEYHIHINI